MIRSNSYTIGYEWLSNFSPHAVLDQYGVECKTVEHAYQAAKTTDPVERERIIAAPTPRAAKRLGKHVVVRPGWDTLRVNVMHYLVGSKFCTHEDLRVKLIATGDEELVHLAPWDRFWGADENGVGENRLGKIIMEWRSIIRDTSTDAAGPF